MSKDKADEPKKKGDKSPEEKKAEKNPSQPNNDVFNGHIKKIREDIRKIDTEMDVLKQRREELKNDKGKDEVSQARRACGDIVKQIKDLQGERKAILDKRSEIDAERKEIDAQQKDLSKTFGGRPMDRDELEKEIRKIEIQHETSGSMNLKRERNMLHKLQELKKNFAVIDTNQNLGDDMKSKRTQMQELVTKAQAIQTQVDELRAELTKKQAHLDSLQGKANPGADIPKKMNDLWTKKKELQQKIRDDSAVHQKKWEEWKVYDQEKRKKDKEEREKRFAARRIEREAENEERKKVRDEGKRLNPYEPELDTCSTLIAYLSRLAGLDTRTGGRKEAAAKAPAKALPAGFEIKTKDDDDKGSFGLAKKKGGKGPGAKKASTNKVLTHSMEKYSSFHKLNLEIPQTVAQIPETLEKLKEKQAHFSTFIKSQDDIDAEDAAAAAAKAAAPPAVAEEPAAAPADHAAAEEVEEAAAAPAADAEE